MTKVTFETSTLADAFKKASLVAPTKGAALDKAAGILVTITPGSDTPVVIRATNTQVYYTEIVGAIEIEGEAVVWRLPGLAANLMAAFPIGSGKQVTMETEGNAVRFKQGRLTAKLNLISSDYYPQWDAFDPSGLENVSALGERMKQVQWAASTSANTEPLSGLHFDGARIICTDKYRIALADCDISHAIAEPFTVPAGILGSIIKQMGDTRMGTDGEMLLLMPDDHTQIKAVIYGQKFPNVDRVISKALPEELTVSKDALLEIIRQASTITGADRMPTLRLFIGSEEIAAMQNNEVLGFVGNVVEVPGQALHDRVEIKFTPKMLTDAIDQSPNDEITLHYSTVKSGKAMFSIDGGSGYRAWVMPRLGDAPQQG